MTFPREEVVGRNQGHLQAAGTVVGLCGVRRHLKWRWREETPQLLLPLSSYLF